MTDGTRINPTALPAPAPARVARQEYVGRLDRALMQLMRMNPTTFQAKYYHSLYGNPHMGLHQVLLTGK